MHLNNASSPCSEITFDLDFLIRSRDYDSIDSFHEGVELSFRSLVEDGEDTTQSDSDWVPLVYFASNLNLDTDDTISLVEKNTLLENETQGNFMLRGYSVPYVIASRGQRHVTLCSGADLLDHPVELRWLQTSSLINRNITEDVIMLDNIGIRLQNSSHYASLFDENFDNQTSLW